MCPDFKTIECNFTLENNTFNSNQADLVGGGIYYTDY